VPPIADNGEEGRHFITNRRQILHHHGKTSKIDLADAKYDEQTNYQFSRSHAAIPTIDYNSRSESLTATSIKERGHDHNGWPLAPCGFTLGPTGSMSIVKEQAFPAEGSVSHQKIRRLLNTPGIVLTGSIIMGL